MTPNRGPFRQWWDPKDRRSRHAWRDLLEQLQPFPAQAVFESHETGGVAARPRQAVDEAGADRIDDDREHDRHRAGRLQQRPHGRAMGQDDVRRERDQFRRVSANFGGIGRGPAGVDPHVAADAPAQERQPLLERPDAGLIFRIVRGCGQEYADAPHPLGLPQAPRPPPKTSPAPAGPREGCCEPGLSFWAIRDLTSGGKAPLPGVKRQSTPPYPRSVT